MVYLLVEISGHRQLAKLRGGVVAGLVESITGLVRYSGGNAVVADKGMLLLSVDPEGKTAEAQAELVYRVYEILLQRRRELQGFTVYAEEFDDLNPGLALARLAQSSLVSDRTDILRIGDRLRSRLEGLLIVRPAGEFADVLGRSERMGHSYRLVHDFLVREPVVELLLSILTPLVNRERPPGWVHVYGLPLCGKSQNVSAALRRLAAAEGNPPWLTLFSASDGLPSAAPFIESLRPDFMDRVPEYLKPAERAAWEQRKSVLELETCADHFEEDFFAAYCHYLLAYIRFMDRKGLPPIVVCEQFHAFGRGSHELLARVIEKFRDFSPIIPICVSDSPVVPEALAAVPRSAVEIAPLGLEELREALGALPEGAEVDAEDLLLRTEGRPLYASHYVSLSVKADQRGERISLDLLRQIEETCRKSLYVLYLTEGILGIEEARRFLGREGLVPEVVESALGRLVSLGFVRKSTGQVVLPSVAALLEGEFRPDGLQAKAAEYFYGQWKQGALRGSERLVRFVALWGRFEQAADLFFQYATELLDRSEVDQVLDYLQREDVFPTMLDPAQARKRDFFLDILALRASVLLKEKDQSELRVTKAKEERPEGDWELSLYELSCAQHLYAAREIRAALDSAKRALIASQRVEAPRLEYRANIEIGLAMLANTRLEEAEDYFTIARESSGGEERSYDSLRSLGFEAVTHFDFGNYSKAIRTADAASEVAVAICRREWQRFLIFLRGRCHFALGLYDEAAGAFQTGTSLCRVYPHAAASRVFEAWTARAAYYAGTRQALKTLEEMDPSGEVLFFTGEIRAGNGEWAEAAALFDRALRALDDEREAYLPSEIVSWRSGFAGIEDRAFRGADGHGVLHHMARAMKAYVVAHLEDSSEGVAELTRITREDKLSDQDPNESFYYFLHSQILPEGQGDLLVDRLTVLNKALKHAQERATRIDEVKMRRAFLQSNRWNVRLFADARKHKLV